LAAGPGCKVPKYCLCWARVFACSVEEQTGACALHECIAPRIGFAGTQPLNAALSTELDTRAGCRLHLRSMSALRVAEQATQRRRLRDDGACAQLCTEGAVTSRPLAEAHSRRRCQALPARNLDRQRLAVHHTAVAPCGDVHEGGLTASPDGSRSACSRSPPRARRRYGAADVDMGSRGVAAGGRRRCADGAAAGLPGGPAGVWLRGVRCAPGALAQVARICAELALRAFMWGCSALGQCVYTCTSAWLWQVSCG